MSIDIDNKEPMFESSDVEYKEYPVGTLFETKYYFSIGSLAYVPNELFVWDEYSGSQIKSGDIKTFFLSHVLSETSQAFLKKYTPIPISFLRLKKIGNGAREELEYIARPYHREDEKEYRDTLISTTAILLSSIGLSISLREDGRMAEVVNNDRAMVAFSIAKNIIEMADNHIQQEVNGFYKK